MRLLIVSERPETAQRLSALLTAIGHEPHVTVVSAGDGAAIVRSVAMLAPGAILLDAPAGRQAAVLAVRTLQGDDTARWIPTVLLTEATPEPGQRWVNPQLRLDHRICMLPFHGAPNALYRLASMLHGLAPQAGEMIRH